MLRQISSTHEKSVRENQTSPCHGRCRLSRSYKSVTLTPSEAYVRDIHFTYPSSVNSRTGVHVFDGVLPEYTSNGVSLWSSRFIRFFLILLLKWL